MEQYRRNRSKGEASLFKTLGSALQLYRLSEENENHKAELKKLLAQNQIRITKRTKNQFTPIVKLIFAGEIRETEKSLVMRCAGTLRLADSNNVDPADIARFVTDQGGIVECYKRDREAHSSATATGTKQDSIEALRKTAQKCEPTALRKFVPDGLAAALLDFDQGGNILLLGARGATLSDIRRCKISTNSTAKDID
jgi:hypothetical protein